MPCNSFHDSRKDAHTMQITQIIAEMNRVHVSSDVLLFNHKAAIADKRTDVMYTLIW